MIHYQTITKKSQKYFEIFSHIFTFGISFLVTVSFCAGNYEAANFASKFSTQCLYWYDDEKQKIFCYGFFFENFPTIS